MGIKDLTAKDKDGRVYNLLQESKVIEALF